MKNEQKTDIAIGIQGIYYLITALWPLIHRESFELFIGDKPDLFQFYTTALLILVIALSLLFSIGKKKGKNIVLLSLGTPLAFMLVELWFRDTISSYFLVDFVIEALFFVSLGYLFLKSKQK